MYVLDEFLRIFCVKCSKWVFVNIFDLYPREDGQDGLDEEGHEEECLCEHQGHQDQWDKCYNL